MPAWVWASPVFAFVHLNAKRNKRGRPRMSNHTQPRGCPRARHESCRSLLRRRLELTARSRLLKTPFNTEGEADHYKAEEYFLSEVWVRLRIKFPGIHLAIYARLSKRSPAPFLRSSRTEDEGWRQPVLIQRNWPGFTWNDISPAPCPRILTEASAFPPL
jgi:hypothetical protein